MNHPSLKKAPNFRRNIPDDHLKMTKKKSLCRRIQAVLKSKSCKNSVSVFACFNKSLHSFPIFQVKYEAMRASSRLWQCTVMLHFAQILIRVMIGWVTGSFLIHSFLDWTLNLILSHHKCFLLLIRISQQTFKQLFVELRFNGTNSHELSIRSLVGIVEGSSTVQHIFSSRPVPQTNTTRFP